MSNQNNLKISHIFNLPNLNFKTQMNIAIDSNAHIKNIINVNAYMYDTEIDVVTAKCNVKGKLGLKILYLDVDNVYNTITDETSFSESVTSTDLTSDCKINMFNEQISTEVDFDEKYLKVSLNVNAKLYSEIDTGISLPNTNLDGIIIKKTPVDANVCVESINNRVSEDCVLNLPHRASKILSVNIVPNIQTIDCNDGYLTISGQSLIQIIYDFDKDNSSELKLYNETCQFKFETQATLSQSDCVADIGLKVNNSKTSFTTELDDNQTNIKLDYEMVVCGFIFKTISLDYIQDIYSTDNEIETTYSNRQITQISPLIAYKTNIEGEIQLLEENNTDEIIETVNHSCLITQNYTDSNKLVLEGVITSTLIYLNEQREIKSMRLELPFSIAKEYENDENYEMLNFEILPTFCKAKLKRGNSLSLDYEVCIQGYIVNKLTTNMLENIKFGKSFDYGDISYQIIITKPNESLWDFCKRTHTTHDQLDKCNKEIPVIFEGGEKIIICR